MCLSNILFFESALNEIEVPKGLFIFVVDSKTTHSDQIEMNKFRVKISVQNINSNQINIYFLLIPNYQILYLLNHRLMILTHSTKRFFFELDD